MTIRDDVQPCPTKTIRATPSSRNVHPRRRSVRLWILKTCHASFNQPESHSQMGQAVCTASSSHNVHPRRCSRFGASSPSSRCITPLSTIPAPDFEFLQRPSATALKAFVPNRFFIFFASMYSDHRTVLHHPPCSIPLADVDCPCSPEFPQCPSAMTFSAFVRLHLHDVSPLNQPT